MIIIGIIKYVSYSTRQVSLPHDHQSNGFFNAVGKGILGKILCSIATSCRILRNYIELPVFYSILGVQTLNKLGIILDGLPFMDRNQIITND